MCLSDQELECLLSNKKIVIKKRDNIRFEEVVYLAVAVPALVTGRGSISYI